VKKGTKVTFVNNSTSAFQPASAPHPAHTDYPEFDPKRAIAAGASWEFTFDKVGTWRYHDHLNPTRFGTVIVTE
jgi:plastocyanin